ncbi:MAG: GNAT family N-acetyltransferase [Alphaproteobacteria bacterium]|nr:GNAT family N-acetyltransferase [Alphaproteobacteria bacterium]MBU1525995.1 GNAT family N-acetyltransferase [Alphaproteobacteria bacterium]MBU2117462.1 GNAT family N-acetyltransferase [Alphaproteobacteria bacterium]MBU2350403.1 GNAT family N-acetyltransferase [Alphaproteobacteria bacterium]MBU2383263.1 GNAT family N-acetyltransferase [Alphaproteobacteria bacterium]
MRIEARPLQNGWVRCEPLEEGLREEVRDAISGDAAAWAIMVSNGAGAAFDGWFDQRVAHMRSGGGPAYAVRRLSTGRIVGTSSLHDLVPAHRRVELGSTVYHPDARGTEVNPASKRLLLDHAFASGIVRVEIITDAVNVRSQAAIARLGAAREGVLRRHKITWTGRVRDTVMFAITDADWPDVRDRLDARLAGV